MQNLLDVLAEPGTLAKLDYREAEGAFVVVGQPGRKYRIDKGVPYFLPETKTAVVQDGPNVKHGTEFEYLDHYTKDAEVFDYFETPADPATVHENRRLHEVILRKLPGKGMRLLDVGCGGAWLAAATIPEQTLVVSFDVAHRNTTEAQKKHRADNHFAVTGDVYKLPFRSDSFDAVVSAEVIEHVPDVSGYLDSLLRVVKPGGRVIVSTPYDEKIQYSLCIHCNRVTPLHAHLRSFKENTLAKYLAERGDVNCHTEVFSSKVLLMLRTHVLLKYLPLRLWRWVDGLANRLVRKPSRLIYVLDKQAGSGRPVRLL
ncbi:MAG: methyltransferase domain-containing protein [Bacteroidota bacterium]